MAKPSPLAPAKLSADDAALVAQGAAAHRLGRLQEAAALYRQVLGRTPNQPDTLRLLGLAVLDMGMGPAALELLKAAASIGNSGLFWADLGRVYARQNKSEQAEQALRKAIERSPNEPSFHWDLALLLRQSGQLDAARQALEAVYRLAPDHPKAVIVLAQTLFDLRQPTAALAALAPYLARHPAEVEAHVMAGLCEMQRNTLDAAAKSFERALLLTPHDPVPLGNLSLIRQIQGQIDQAIAFNDQARRSAPQRTDLISNRLMAAQYHPQATAESLYQLHCALAPALERRAKALIPASPDPDFQQWDRAPDRPLRVGYLSPDLGRHPVGFFLSALLPHHDPAQVQPVAYSDRITEDAISDRLKASPGLTWVPSAALSLPALAERIRADRIDILIDLAGHTARNRLPIFAARVAPIQLTWAGYVGTTGLSTIDGLIADRYHVRPGEEAHYCETVLRLPQGYVPYAPPPDLPPVAPSPAALRGEITFGSTNGLAKITPAVADLWAHVLARVPRSRLLVKTEALSDRPTAALFAQRLTEAMARHGVASERLSLAGQSPHAEHLAFYGEIDILLDPFPYSGGLTTLEALWMGVPVVTMPGPTFASRHSTSHLSVAGLADLCVAEDALGYVEKAAVLASDVALLASLRGSLREGMARSPINDGPGFTRGFEAVLRRVWKGWVGG
jgi:predicted O-linked N-acetylglucosamine transferase (SPINDLY family)